jgi:hypothetical protein
VELLLLGGSAVAVLLVVLTALFAPRRHRAHANGAGTRGAVVAGDTDCGDDDGGDGAGDGGGNGGGGD